MNNIEAILAQIETLTGIKPEAFSSKSVQYLPAISFTLYKQRDNAVIENWRLQLRFVAESLEEAMDLEKIVSDSLVSLGDEEVLGALRIELNGGGVVEDENTGIPQVLAFYDIQNRS